MFQLLIRHLAHFISSSFDTPAATFFFDISTLRREELMPPLFSRFFFAIRHAAMPRMPFTLERACFRLPRLPLRHDSHIFAAHYATPAYYRRYRYAAARQRSSITRLSSPHAYHSMPSSTSFVHAFITHLQDTTTPLILPSS